MGTFKVRNEIETKRIEINEMKRNQQKRNEVNQRNENEINENKTKYDARLLSTHVSVSFTRRGQDLITIEQEYYAFIQRESVLFT
jgi:galactitol-specific phosphotransferase system IIB component